MPNDIVQFNVEIFKGQIEELVRAQRGRKPELAAGVRGPEADPGCPV